MHRPRPLSASRARDVRRASYALAPGIPALQADPRRHGRLALGAFLLGVAIAAPVGWQAAMRAPLAGRSLVALGPEVRAADPLVRRAAAALADTGQAGRELAAMLVGEIDRGADAGGRAALRAALAAHAAGR